MLQLYTWDPNSNSGKPNFMLKAKGVDFDFQMTARRAAHLAK